VLNKKHAKLAITAMVIYS